jgi:adenylate cyclase
MNAYPDKLKDIIEELSIPKDEKGVLLQLLGRIEKELKAMNFKLERALKDKKTLSTLLSRTSEDLEKSSELIKKMFGRYLSTEVMNSLLEDPTALELGGEKRKVTIMMTDLRGFTALSERLKPEQVLQMLNSYFEVMVEVILQYSGTINEIIGDALLVIFGAPQEMADRAQRAIACAIEMQNAMGKVNENNRARGLPELEMGIGVNETEVIVGNIGSSKRSKYAVVGSGVNMTSRIESYTVGGQILISESVRQKVGEVLRIDSKREVTPKGAEVPLTIYEVGGIAGPYNLAIERDEPAKVTLVSQIPVEYKVLGGKHVGKKGMKGHIAKLSKKSCEVALTEPLALLANVKMNLGNVDAELAAKDFYGKVIEQSRKQANTYFVRFTAVPPEISAYFQALRQYAAKGMSAEKT